MEEGYLAKGAKKIAFLKLSATATDEKGGSRSAGPRIMQDEARLQDPHARKLWPTVGCRRMVACEQYNKLEQRG